MAVSVLDLPQVWQKPGFDVLLQALKELRVDLPTWHLNSSPAQIVKKQDTSAEEPREIAAYLSTIIKSGLAWLSDDDDREAIWEEASKRFSERCGRCAMGDITRTWSFQCDDYAPFDLLLREPALTGDNLGLKTWGSSYVLAQMLHLIGQASLSHLLRRENKHRKPAVLELGSGTGLLGLAAAVIWQTHVILSDLPEIMPNLDYNVAKNRSTVQQRGGSVVSGVLKWGGEGDCVDPVVFSTKNNFKIVVVADPLYDDEHHGLLAGVIDDQLTLDDEARALVMVPHRDAATTKLLSAFRQDMASRPSPLICLEENIVAGQDDWGSGQDEAGEIRCWLGIFGRQG